MPWTEPSAAQTPWPGSAAIRAVPIGWKASSRSSEGLKRVASNVGELARREDADAGDVGVDLGGAGGEVDFGGAGDAEGEPVGVVVGQLVAGPQRAVAAEPDPAGGAVGEVDADRADVAEVEHRPLVARGRRRAARRRRRRAG